MEHYIGIDNSSLDHKVRVINENGKQNLSFIVANTFNGFEELNKKLEKFENIQIGFELPHGPLVDYLHEHDSNKCCCQAKDEIEYNFYRTLQTVSWYLEGKRITDN